MITGTVGRGGSGKTLSTIKHLWALHKVKRREIVSNTPLVDLRVRWDANGMRWIPVDHHSFGMSWATQYIQVFDEVMGLDNCEVLIDEAGAWMPANKHNSMPAEMRNFIAQDRREGVNIHWTHRTTRVWVDLRENTASITRCQRYGPVIVMKVTDPEEPKGRDITNFAFVKPGIYDLYQTFARVGSAETGLGYGYGSRTGYRSNGATGDMLTIDASPWNPDHENLIIKVRPNQLQVLMRKFGPEALGVEREVNQWGAIRWRLPIKTNPGILPDGPYHRSTYRDA